MRDSQESQVKLDIMRYTKNKLSANLVLLAILFDVFFFVSIYKSDVGTYYYSILTGASIIVNLLFMLIAFLCSEGIKNYKGVYAYIMAGLGAIQVVRIFIIPLKAVRTSMLIGKVETQVMSSAQFLRCVVYLAVSAVALFVAAAVGAVKSKKLADYLASLGTEERRD